MRRSKIVSPLHFVWATYERRALITAEIEERVHACLCTEAEALGCEVLAVGGMPDHVHIAVLFPATRTYGQFAKQLKGASSRLITEVLLPPESFFYWQEGYAVFGFSHREKDTVIAYIRNQKQRHALSRLWDALEQTDEEVPSSEGRPHPQRGISMPRNGEVSYRQKQNAEES